MCHCNSVLLWHWSIVPSPGGIRLTTKKEGDHELNRSGAQCPAHSLVLRPACTSLDQAQRTRMWRGKPTAACHRTVGIREGGGQFHNGASKRVKCNVAFNPAKSVKIFLSALQQVTPNFNNSFARETQNLLVKWKMCLKLKYHFQNFKASETAFWPVLPVVRPTYTIPCVATKPPHYTCVYLVSVQWIGTYLVCLLDTRSPRKTLVYCTKSVYLVLVTHWSAHLLECVKIFLFLSDLRFSQTTVQRCETWLFAAVKTFSPPCGEGNWKFSNLFSQFRGKIWCSGVNAAMQSARMK